jgi:hypothetical protein
MHLPENSFVVPRVLCHGKRISYDGSGSAAALRGSKKTAGLQALPQFVERWTASSALR